MFDVTSSVQAVDKHKQSPCPGPLKCQSFSLKCPQEYRKRDYLLLQTLYIAPPLSQNYILNLNLRSSPLFRHPAGFEALNPKLTRVPTRAQAMVQSSYTIVNLDFVTYDMAVTQAVRSEELCLLKRGICTLRNEG